MIYVMSDIHGHLREFNEILHRIHFTEDDTLYILGDVVDKGPNSIALIKQIMAMHNAQMLLGNHEHMMLGSIGYGSYDDTWSCRKTHLWHRNAGRRTEEQLYKEDDTTREEILKFVYGLPLFLDINVNGTDFRLVHAAPIELFGKVFAPELQDKRSFVVWYRMDEGEELFDDKIVVFGHTPTWYFQDNRPPVIWHGQNRINLDCGCAYGGRLGCLRLDDMTEFYSEIVED